MTSKRIISLVVIAMILVITAIIFQTVNIPLPDHSIVEPVKTSTEQTQQPLTRPAVNISQLKAGEKTIPKQQDEPTELPVVNKQKTAEQEVNAADVVLPPPPDQDKLNDGDTMISNGPFYTNITQQNAVVTALQERFDAEPYDQIWAHETEQQLLDLFIKQQLTGNQLIEAACRSTFCRIDISHADIAAERGFMAAFALNGQFIDDGERGYYYRETDINGAINTVFYYARSGYQLPE